MDTIVRAGLACVLLLAAAQGAMGQTIGSSPGATGSSPSPKLSMPRARGAAQSDVLRNVDRALDDIQCAIADAYFVTALDLVSRRREWLDELDPLDGLATRRARLEVLAATAQVALGRRRRAQESMSRALQADPELILDEPSTPPKVYALLRKARTRATARSEP